MIRLSPLVPVFALLCLTGAACSGSSSKSDGGPDGSATKIEELPIAAELNLPGLDSKVEVVTDKRGMRHIYATSDHDVFMVQGYLMARDRMAQMEFLRRAVEGRLSEVAYTFVTSLLETDIGSRMLGFARAAQAIAASLPSGDETMQVLTAFSSGVNAFIGEIRSGKSHLPDGLPDLIRTSLLTDWTPTDTLAIARYMSWDLSRSSETEIALTQARAAIAQAFPPTSPDPKIAARAVMLHDFWSFAPAEPVFTRNGFPTPAPNFPGLVPPPATPARLPPIPMLARARSFFERTRLPFTFRGAHGGSNNWVVHGSKTESGNPLLANDPHLGFDSPPKFWYVHLNTKRAGGDLDSQGLALAGAPGILLGYNDHVAWGLTTADYDVQDVYDETITPGAAGAPDTVLFNGQQVPIEKITEVIPVNIGSPKTVVFERVPHHGIIIPDSRTATEGLSVRWTGDDISNELLAVLHLMKSQTADEVKAALTAFDVGAQNFVSITRDGDIAWNTHSRVPIRDPRALTYDPATGSGYAPCFVLPGTGEYEWTGQDLEAGYLPQDLNPAKGFIATANNDLIGLTANGNPFNGAHYLGFDWDSGHRIARITSRLQDLVNDGKVTPQDMSALQGDDRSPLGATLAPSLVAAVDAAKEEYDTPGTHPDLTAALTTAGADFPKLLQMRDRLAAWSGEHTPPAVEGTPTPQEIANSVAATIFNATIPRLMVLAFQDELSAIGGITPGDDYTTRLLERALLTPQKLRTYDGGIKDTVLWDDLGTPDVQESRNDRIVRALLGALQFLEGKLGADMDGWRWGKLHTVLFATLIPMFDQFTIPPPNDPNFANGFPRHGDNFCVDAAHTGLWSKDDFTYSGGPMQRLVVEMTPTGPKIWNAIPGGEVHDYNSPHHADEAELWRKNQAPPLYFQEIDVVQNAETRERFSP